MPLDQQTGVIHIGIPMTGVQAEKRLIDRLSMPVASCQHGHKLSIGACPGLSYRVFEGRGGRTTCASTASSLRLHRAHTCRPLTQGAFGYSQDDRASAAHQQFNLCSRHEHHHHQQELPPKLATCTAACMPLLGQVCMGCPLSLLATQPKDSLQCENHAS